VEEERPRRHERSRADDAPVDDRPSRSKLLPIVLALAVLLGGGLLIKSLVGGDDADDDTFTPASPRPRASASTAPSKPATYTPAQIELALKDPHFKHGYDAGKAKAAQGAVTDPEATCREMGLAERTQGYPWGAHDRQGCLVGITS
jgi:hypothetical protein